MNRDTLTELRQKIDGVDEEIIRLIARRQNLAARVAAFKTGPQGIVDSRREEEVLAVVRAKAGEYGLDPGWLEQIYRLLFQGAAARQRQLLTAPDRRADENKT